MANCLFGIGGASRLWKRIREGEGLSYNVRSTIDWNRRAATPNGPVIAIFAPQNQGRVEAALRDELARSIARAASRRKSSTAAGPAC